MMKTDIHKIKTEQAWNRLYDRLDKDHLLVEDHRMPKIPMWVRYGTVAAMVVGLVFSTLYWGFGQKEELPDFITQENQDVPTLVTTLEDGSVVFLAKETSIRYPEHFVSDKREVSLQGDAFFDVAKTPGVYGGGACRSAARRDDGRGARRAFGAHPYRHGRFFPVCHAEKRGKAAMKQVACS